MASPICKLCYNKGFSSQLMGDTNRPEILFCKCLRGANLKKLIDLNYVEREKARVEINKYMIELFGVEGFRAYSTVLNDRIRDLKT